MKALPNSHGQPDCTPFSTEAKLGLNYRDGQGYQILTKAFRLMLLLVIADSLEDSWLLCAALDRISL